MAAPADGKPILKLDVDTQAWDSFADSFNRYQELLANQPAAWANTNKGIKAAGTAFDHVEETFEKLVRSSLDPKFASPTSGIWTRVKKEAVETERSWRNIARDIEKAGRNMTGLARNGLNFASLGMFGAGGVLAGGLFEGTKSAAESLAAQNAQNRALDLAPGEEQAFTTEYKRVGGDNALLAKIAAAKADPRQWRGLMSAGLTGDEIRTQDPVALAAEFLEKAGAKFKAAGDTGGTWAQSTGVADFLGINQLRQAGSYSDSDYQKMQAEYTALVPKLAAQQAALDDATKQTTAFEGALQELKTTLETTLVEGLGPELTTLTAEAADWIKSMAGSGELKKDMDEVAQGFEDVAGVLKKLGIINDDTSGKDHGLNPAMNGTTASGWTTGNWLEREFPSYKAWRERQSDWLGPDTDAGLGTGTTDDTRTTSGKPATMSALLDAIKQNESSGRPDAVNDVTGASGAYGLMPDTWKHYGVNPFDEHASRGAAQKVLSGFLDKYHGDLGMALAAYDGDTHIDADEKKYAGAWWQGAKPETIDYLAKIEKQGLDLHLSKEEQQWIDAHTTVKSLPKPKTGSSTDDSIGGFPVVPYDDPMPSAQTAKDNISETLTQRLTWAAGMVSDALQAGGGRQFREDNRTAQRIDRQGNQPMTPYAINVQVTTPAGASTTVTAGGLPQ